jgi:hypothetical protein
LLITLCQPKNKSQNGDIPMKRSNLLTLPTTNSFKPLFMLNWLPTNLPSLVAVAIVLTTGVLVIEKFRETKTPEIKSVAWYMANQKQALAKNKECYDNPQLKTTENCVYSLQALEITHKGPNS